jgi:hypothetical protein
MGALLRNVAIATQFRDSGLLFFSLLPHVGPTLVGSDVLSAQAQQ